MLHLHESVEGSVVLLFSIHQFYTQIPELLLFSDDLVLLVPFLTSLFFDMIKALSLVL